MTINMVYLVVVNPVSKKSDVGIDPRVPYVCDASVLEPNVSKEVVNKFDFGKYFSTYPNFTLRDDMLKWVCDEVVKLSFLVVIEVSKTSFYRIIFFIIFSIERGGEYKETNKKLKCANTITQKFECPFRLREYYLTSNVWKLNMIYVMHNHELDDKL